MKETFTHTKVEVGAKRPFHVTVCLIEMDSEPRARGIAICSFRDQYNRKLGNRIARGRALKAIALMRNFGPIREVLQREVLWKVAPYQFKAEYLEGRL